MRRGLLCAVMMAAWAGVGLVASQPAAGGITAVAAEAGGITAVAAQAGGTMAGVGAPPAGTAHAPAEAQASIGAPEPTGAGRTSVSARKPPVAAGKAPADAAEAPALKPGGQAEDRYYIIQMSGQKVGHVHEYRRVRDDGVYSSATFNIAMGRMGTTVQMTIQESSLETHDGRPLKAKLTQNLGIMQSTTEVTFRPKGPATAVVTQNGQTRTVSIDCPPDMRLSEGLRLQAKQEGLAQGTRYECSTLELSMLKVLSGTVQVGPRKSVDVLGRSVELTEVSTSMAGMNMAAYLDDDCQPLRSVLPIAGMEVELIAAPKAVALSPYQPMDLMARMLVPCPWPMDGLAGARSARFVLVPHKDAKLDLPRTSFQDVTVQPAGRVIVTVRAVDFPAESFTPGAVRMWEGAELADALKPNSYVQCDDPKVIEAARRQTADARTTEQACRGLERFVREHIQTKDLSVAYATARETLDSRQGDCTEHAVLLAALCRAAGIPAKVVTGLAYAPGIGPGGGGAFAPHAWVAAWSGGKWVPLDAALGFDVAHLALGVGDGDLGDFFDMIGNLGQFDLLDVQLQK